MALASILCSASCTPGVAASARATPPAARIHAGPITDFVPAAGLRWMVVARPSEIAHTPGLDASLELLLPPARLAAFALSTGVDLRTVPSALAAGFDYATLYMAETPDENARVEARFVQRLVTGGTPVSSGGVRRVSGTVGQSPQTLVRIDRQLVAVSVGDPTPARIVELFALERLRSPRALAGSALSTLPRDLEDAPARLYSPGPFPEEWARGARGLLGSALALGIGAWSEPGAIRIRLELSGRWQAEDSARLGSAWDDLATSTMGRLLGLDQPLVPPEVHFTPGLLTLEVRVALVPLASGLHAAVAADVWEMLDLDRRSPQTGSLGTESPGSAGTPPSGGRERRSPSKPDPTNPAPPGPL